MKRFSSTSVSSSTFLGFTAMIIQYYLCLLPTAVAGAGLYTGPYFANPDTRNITIHQGNIAYLPCGVKQLGNKMVSWVRQKDADILTVDKYTFVRDERLMVYYSEDTTTWTLVIKSVQERDAGAYECQISTEPKMSMLVNLHVIVPQVDILGEKEKYVRVGSSVQLECQVSSAVQLPDYIFWYHKGSRLLEYEKKRIHINVSRKESEMEKMMSLTSVLFIRSVEEGDEGNYSCLPSNLDNAYTYLHVLNGEHPAAMQTGAAVRASSFTLHLVILSAIVSLYIPIYSLSTHYKDGGNWKIEKRRNDRQFTSNNECNTIINRSEISMNANYVITSYIYQLICGLMRYSLFCNFLSKNFIISF